MAKVLIPNGSMLSFPTAGAHCARDKSKMASCTYSERLLAESCQGGLILHNMDEPWVHCLLLMLNYCLPEPVTTNTFSSSDTPYCFGYLLRTRAKDR